MKEKKASEASESWDIPELEGYQDGKANKIFSEGISKYHKKAEKEAYAKGFLCGTREKIAQIRAELKDGERK